MCEKATIAL